MSALKQPWDFHPDLSEVRLLSIASLIHRTRNGAMTIKAIPVEHVPWGAGCLAYDLTRNAIIEQAQVHEWLSIVDPGMRFIFSIGSVPVRFYRGEADEPTDRTMARHHDELRQLSFAFGTEAPKPIWRFAVETDVDGTVISISCVGIDESNNVVSKWEYKKSNVVPLAAAPQAQSEAKKLPPPLVKPKGSEDEKDVSA